MSKSTFIGSVIILANEDDAARTIRPRLDAAGADTNKVHIVQGMAREGAPADLFQLDTDIAALRAKAPSSVAGCLKNSSMIFGFAAATAARDAACCGAMP